MWWRWGWYWCRTFTCLALIEVPLLVVSPLAIVMHLSRLAKLSLRGVTGSCERAWKTDVGLAPYSLSESLSLPLTNILPIQPMGLAKFPLEGSMFSLVSTVLSFKPSSEDSSFAREAPSLSFEGLRLALVAELPGCDLSPDAFQATFLLVVVVSID